jgi:hypothetical protein
MNYIYYLDNNILRDSFSDSPINHILIINNFRRSLKLEAEGHANVCTSVFGILEVIGLTTDQIKDRYKIDKDLMKKKSIEFNKRPNDLSFFKNEIRPFIDMLFEDISNYYVELIKSSSFYSEENIISKHQQQKEWVINNIQIFDTVTENLTNINSFIESLIIHLTHDRIQTVETSGIDSINFRKLYYQSYIESMKHDLRNGVNISLTKAFINTIKFIFEIYKTKSQKISAEKITFIEGVIQTSKMKSLRDTVDAEYIHRALFGTVINQKRVKTVVITKDSFSSIINRIAISKTVMHEYKLSEFEMFGFIIATNEEYSDSYFLIDISKVPKIQDISLDYDPMDYFKPISV